MSNLTYKTESDYCIKIYNDLQYIGQLYLTIEDKEWVFKPTTDYCLHGTEILHEIIDKLNELNGTPT